MELVAKKTVHEPGTQTEFSSRWEIVEPLQSTRYRNSYRARNLREDLAGHHVTLTVCRYEERLVSNANYVENVRRRLRHEVEMLALPLNFLPEAVDYFVCQNDEDDFPDRPGTPFGSDEPVLVTESFSGVPIDELIGHGPLDEVRALRIGLRLCDLLNDLHRWQVLAYELRPEDLLVDETDHDRIWVASCANFQKSDEAGRVSPKSLVVPLTDFMFAAPEVEEGRGRLDRRSDLYSLGAMLYHLLTGRDPRQQRTAKKVSWRSIGHLSLETQTCVRRLLSVDPAGRFDDTKSTRAALRRALTSAIEVAEGRVPARRPLPPVTAPGAAAVERAAQQCAKQNAKPDEALVPGLMKIALLPLTAPARALKWVFADPRGS